MVKKLNLVIFVSGRGSNMQAIMKACEDPDFPAQICAIVSNNPEAPALEKAQEKNIPTCVVNHKEFAERKDFEQEILRQLESLEGENNTPDLICLAGFMRILSPFFISNAPCPVINIHPSLLPDYKGQNTHQRVIKDGVKKSGCTVHIVTEDLDSGPIILQKSVDVEENDTPESLAEKILIKEHIAYPEAISLFCNQITSENI